MTNEEEPEISAEDLAHYNDCESIGESRAVYREEHLCLACAVAPICAIAAEAQSRSELMVTVGRCRAFVTVD